LQGHGEQSEQNYPNRKQKFKMRERKREIKTEKQHNVNTWLHQLGIPEEQGKKSEGLKKLQPKRKNKGRHQSKRLMGQARLPRW